MVSFRNHTASILTLLSLVLFSCSKNENNELQSSFPRVVTNIQYATVIDTTGNLKSLELDLYFPPGNRSSEKYPLILLMHGGGFQFGDKDAIISLCKSLSDSGFIAVSMNYRMGWKQLPDCQSDYSDLDKAIYRGMQDVNSALSFLVANAANFAIDTNWIFTGGSSAGGILALNTGYIDDNYVRSHCPDIQSILGNLKNNGNDFRSDYKIKGICSLSGSLCDSSVISATSAIPLISFHGLIDNTVPADYGHLFGCGNLPAYCGSVCIHRRLISCSTPSVIHLLPDHAHLISDIYSQEYVAPLIACFFHHIMAGKPYSGQFTGTVNSCP